jgi:pimeloyl-ACP methyl ester carboxylesterase
VSGARAARRFAAELFPESWQAGLRDRAAQVVGTVPASRYLSLVEALERWTVSEGLDRVTSRTLVIAAERDYGSLEEKRELAARLRGDLVVVHGSRHGTPFDASEATNASLLAFLTDEPAPPEDRLVRDTPDRAQAVSGVRGMVEGRVRCALEI